MCGSKDCMKKHVVCLSTDLLSNRWSLDYGKPGVPLVLDKAEHFYFPKFLCCLNNAFVPFPFLSGQISWHVVLHSKGVDGVWKENRLIWGADCFLWVSTLVTITDRDWLRRMVLGWRRGERFCSVSIYREEELRALRAARHLLSWSTYSSCGHPGLAKSCLIWPTVYAGLY